MVDIRSVLPNSTEVECISSDIENEKSLSGGNSLNIYEHNAIFIWQRGESNLNFEFA